MSEITTETIPDDTTPAAEVSAPKPYKRWTRHQITIHDAERLYEAYVFAQANGLAAQFNESFMRMLNLVAGYHKEADALDRDLVGHVRYDGCRHSFAWGSSSVGEYQTVPPPTRPTTHNMHGGLIFHGPGAGETFAMTLSGNNDNPWCIHT